MNFYSVRDLRSNSRSMWDDLANGNEIVITNNGKPSALVLDVSNDDFDLMLQAVRQAKAMIAFNSMRKQAATSAYMTNDEIDAEIRAARGDE